MIANAGAVGVDWRTLSLSDYAEMLEAHNEASDPNAAKQSNGPVAVSDGLRKFMAAHS